MWSKGKQEIRKYYELNIKKSTDFKSMIFGMVLTLIVVFPLLILLIQFFRVYSYQPSLRILLIILAWFLLQFCNGLSNYFMVELAKVYYPENPNLTRINSKAILMYESFNIGFALTTLAIIFIFGTIILGAL